MKMKRILSSILALTICVVSSSNAFAATADNKKSQTEEDYKFTVKANQDQLELINELKGKKMSRLKFYESVFPDLVPKFSDNQKERYASEPFEDLTKTSANTSTPDTDSSIINPNYIVLALCNATISQDSDDRSITGKSTCREITPIPPTPLEMVIDVSVINSDGWLDAYSSTDEDDVTYAEVEATVYNPVKGLQYVATGYFTITDWASVQMRNATASSPTLTSK